MAEVFFTGISFFFNFGYPYRETGVKVGPRVQNLVCPFSLKHPLQYFQTMFLFDRVLPQLRISAELVPIWGSKDPKTFQKGRSHEC